MANEPNWEELLKPRGGRPSPQQFLNMVKWLQPLIVVALMLGWLATGIYMVQPGEVGVVRRFGKENRQAQPGLRWHLPFPIEQRNVVNMERVRDAAIGVQPADVRDRRRSQWARDESLMLTGDENIVDAQMVVQYKVKDPTRFLFRLRDPEEALRHTAEVALRSRAGNITIDQILTVGRAKVQQETKVFLQELLDRYESGLEVLEVLLQVVDPPEQVKDAFHEVVRAREDREKLIRQAQGYEEDIIPKARGKAEQVIRGAEAYKEEQVLHAQGDTARFLALLAEYRKAPQVTRTRLQLDTVQQVLIANKTVVLDPSAGKQITPLLPMGGLPIAPTAGEHTAQEQRSR